MSIFAYMGEEFGDEKIVLQYFQKIDYTYAKIKNIKDIIFKENKFIINILNYENIFYDEEFATFYKIHRCPS